MSDHPIRVLLIEDNPADARLLQGMLTEAITSRTGLARRFEFEHVLTLGEGIQCLDEKSYDVIFLDLLLPDSRGLSTLTHVYPYAPGTPIVVLTNLDDEELAAKAVQAGAQDYLTKGEIDSHLLGHVLRYSIERKRGEVALVAQKRLFENLTAIARATAERLTLQDTLQNVLQVTVTLTGAELASLFLLDENGIVTHSMLATGDMVPFHREDLLERVNKVMDRGLAGWVAQHRQTALIGDLDQDDRWIPLSGYPSRARSALAVPIMSGPILLGILTLTHVDPGHFNAEHAQLMEAAVDQLALALRNSQIYEEQRRLADRQATLYEILRAVGGHLDPRAIARAAVEVVGRLTDWPGVEIFLPNAGATHLITLAAAGSASVAAGWRHSVSQGITGRAFRTGQTQLVHDVSADPDYLAGRSIIRSELAVPLCRGEAVLGVLNLESDEPAAFDTDDVLLAESMSEAIALALDNARLYTAVERELVERKRVEQALRESEVKHRLLLNSIRSPVLALKEDMTILYCNDAYAEFVGRPAEDLRGKNLIAEFPEFKDRPSFAAYQTVLETGEEAEVEGKWQDRHLSCRVYRTPWGILSIVEDVSERRQAEQQLRLQAAALASAANGIVITNRDGLIIWVNPAFCQLTGYTEDELLGQNPRLLKSGKHEPSFYQKMWETILSGQVWRDELINRRKDGSLYVEEMTITPVRDGQGEIAYFIAIKQDVTERKRAERDLYKAIEAAEAANRAKSTFLSNMSHELRTPLNAVIGYSDLIQEEVLDLGYDDIVPDLERIRQAGNQLLAIINDILDLSKIEAGRMELSLDTFLVSVLVDSVMSTVQPMADQNGNTLEVQLGDDLDTMYADMPKVRQILLNLLSNAAKFTEGGTITLTASKETAEEMDWYVFRVSDSGIGISPEQMASLFQPFTQADSTATRKYSGSGLGLAISQRFCEMMGGVITVESELGQGSTFTVRLPAVVAHSLPERGVVDAARPVPVEGLQSQMERAVPLTRGAGVVLVIDDDPAACDLIRRVLRREGFQAVTAQSGEEGLRLAREVHPDVITLDVLMPETDGWAVLAALKSDPDLVDIPVIMVTFVDDRGQGLALGASEYLVKPIDSKRLIALVRKCHRETGRVLVVEDERTVREILQMMLEQEGWDVIEADNGRTALERVAEGRPDLILLDLVMPEMDGFQFLDELREQPDWQSIPIIVVTGKRLTAEEYQRLDGYVEKILQKEAYSSQELLREIRDRVVSLLGRDSRTGN